MHPSLLPWLVRVSQKVFCAGKFRYYFLLHLASPRVLIIVPQPTLRRLITRVLGLIPSVIVASVIGENGINALLVATQVVLSIILPFIIVPLLYLTSSSRIMSVKSQSGSPSPTQPPPGSLALHAIDRVDASRDKEADSEEQVVDFSNGKIMIATGCLMWLIIVAANLYALATL